MQKLPQISQIYTDADLRYSPTEFTEHTEPFAIKICVNLWNLWEFFSARKFCVFCEICGSFSQQKVLCILWILWEFFSAESPVYSVNSVGVFLSRKFCVFREFCGRLSQQSEFCGRIQIISLTRHSGWTSSRPAPPHHQADCRRSRCQCASQARW